MVHRNPQSMLEEKDHLGIDIQLGRYYMWNFLEHCKSHLNIFLVYRPDFHTVILLDKFHILFDQYYLYSILDHMVEVVLLLLDSNGRLDISGNTWFDLG